MVAKKGYNFCVEELEKFEELLYELDIALLKDHQDVSEIREFMSAYSLLPNDALIAATCKHYGIRKIATFDEDFKRVDFLEIVIV